MAEPAAAGDVVVVGAGLIGLASAWRAAERGRQVTLVDPAPGSGASWAAAGMLAPVTEVHHGEEALLALTLAAAARYPSFVAALEAATGVDVGYRTTGTVVVARDRDDRAALAELAAFQQRLGLEVEELTSRELRRLEPALAPSVRGGLLVAGDHQVDNRALTTALRAACARAGVREVADRVTAVDSTAGRVTAVRLASGRRLPAEQVVLAAGWASATVEGLPAHVRPPVRPVKGQLLHLRGPADAPLATRTIRGLEVYVVPRADGRLVVGATVEERGEDVQVTAGGVHELLRRAYELLPGVTELDFVEATAGLRPGSPDNAPLLGPTALDGLVLATGHHRNGVLLAPITADIVVEVLATGELPEIATAFAVERFGDRTPAGVR